MAKAKKEPTMEVQGADASGNQFLPGQEQTICVEVNDMVKNIEQVLKPAFGTARDELISGKSELQEYVLENKERICVFDESGQKWIYNAGGVYVEVAHEETETVTFKLTAKAE